MTIGEFAEAVKTGSEKLGGSITSWGRTPARNKLVGGSPNSRHLTWFAVDVIYDSAVEEAARKDIWEPLGLHVYPEGDHDHISVMTDGRF